MKGTIAYVVKSFMGPLQSLERENKGTWSDFSFRRMSLATMCRLEEEGPAEP